MGLPIGLDLGGGDEEMATHLHQHSMDLTPLRCAWAAMPEVRPDQGASAPLSCAVIDDARWNLW